MHKSGITYKEAEEADESDEADEADDDAIPTTVNEEQEHFECDNDNVRQIFAKILNEMDDGNDRKEVSTFEKDYAKQVFNPEDQESQSEGESDLDYVIADFNKSTVLNELTADNMSTSTSDEDCYTNYALAINDNGEDEAVEDETSSDIDLVERFEEVFETAKQQPLKKSTYYAEDKSDKQQNLECITTDMIADNVTDVGLEVSCAFKYEEINKMNSFSTPLDMNNGSNIELAPTYTEMETEREVSGVEEIQEIDYQNYNDSIDAAASTSKPQLNMALLSTKLKFKETSISLKTFERRSSDMSDFNDLHSTGDDLYPDFRDSSPPYSKRNITKQPTGQQKAHRKNFSFSNDRTYQIERDNLLIAKKLASCKSRPPSKVATTHTCESSAAINRRKKEYQTNIENKRLSQRLAQIAKKGVKTVTTK